MLKILEFVEAGEYETAWSLAVATGREERLVDLLMQIKKDYYVYSARQIRFMHELSIMGYDDFLLFFQNYRDYNEHNPSVQNKEIKRIYFKIEDEAKIKNENYKKAFDYMISALLSLKN